MTEILHIRWYYYSQGLPAHCAVSEISQVTKLLYGSLGKMLYSQLYSQLPELILHQGEISGISLKVQVKCNSYIPFRQRTSQAGTIREGSNLRQTLFQKLLDLDLFLWVSPFDC